VFGSRLVAVPASGVRTTEAPEHLTKLIPQIDAVDVAFDHPGSRSWSVRW
jgi:hypothetical protein